MRQFQAVLLFKTFLWQFQTFWVSETRFYDKTVYTGLYRGIYRPLSETASPDAYINEHICNKRIWWLTDAAIVVDLCAFVMFLWKFWLIPSYIDWLWRDMLSVEWWAAAAATLLSLGAPVAVAQTVTGADGGCWVAVVIASPSYSSQNRFIKWRNEHWNLKS